MNQEDADMANDINLKMRQMFPYERLALASLIWKGMCPVCGWVFADRGLRGYCYCDICGRNRQ